MPSKIELKWGTDTLVVDDPIWVDKILSDLGDNSVDDWDDDEPLSDPDSLEHLDAARHDPSSIGYRAPMITDCVAIEALKSFLGLELPVALSVRRAFSSTVDRFTVVSTRFELRDLTPDACVVCWVFRGYHLNNNHRVGSLSWRHIRTHYPGGVDRRLLTGQWVPWSFGGAFEHNTSDGLPPRAFVLKNGEIQCLVQEQSEADSA